MVVSLVVLEMELESNVSSGASFCVAEMLYLHWHCVSSSGDVG
jgi:hypothetical protein